jgi:hypothetical protein
MFSFFFSSESFENHFPMKVCRSETFEIFFISERKRISSQSNVEFETAYLPTSRQWSACHLAGDRKMIFMNFSSMRMIFVYLLCQFSSTASVSSIGYPWNTLSSTTSSALSISDASVSSLHQQQTKILSKLSKINLDILSENLPPELLSNQELYFYKNSSSLQYSCHLHSLPLTQLSTHNETETFSLSKFQQKLCYDFPVDWWSYQWCHELEVKQYHLEMKGKRKTIKNPEWSLGQYDHTEYVRDDFDHIVKVKQHFSGGQICHENNHQRSSEVL